MMSEFVQTGEINVPTDDGLTLIAPLLANVKIDTHGCLERQVELFGGDLQTPNQCPVDGCGACFNRLLDVVQHDSEAPCADPTYRQDQINPDDTPQ